jgi:hypothetical protein
MPETQPMAAKRSSFRVTCPFCGDSDATVRLNLNDLRQLECSSCDEAFTAAEAVARAQEALEAWWRVAQWIQGAQGLVSDPVPAVDDSLSFRPAV